MLQSLCKFINQSDVIHIMTSPIKKITSVLKASTEIITFIPPCHIRLAEILAVMSVSTFKIVIILYFLFQILYFYTNAKESFEVSFRNVC